MAKKKPTLVLTFIQKRHQKKDPEDTQRDWINTKKRVWRNNAIKDKDGNMEIKRIPAHAVEKIKHKRTGKE